MTTTTTTAAKPRRRRQPAADAAAQPPSICPRPADPEAPLTPAEEATYNLLCQVAAANEEASRDRRALRRQDKPPPVSRVSLSSLPYRARAIRHLLDYANGISPSKSLRTLELSWGDVQICRFADRDYEQVYQLLRYQFGERLTDKALEALERTLDGVETGNAAATSARWLLERLVGGKYQDPRYTYMRQAHAATGGGVAYQINIIQTAAAPAAPIAVPAANAAVDLCGDCVATPAIEVQSTNIGDRHG